MAEFEKIEFEFPDEKEAREAKEAQKEPNLEPNLEPKKAQNGGEEADIEVVDDTPESDRGRKPLSSAPEEPSEDELSQYSESVKQRIQKFTKGYHDERRAKEAALREKEEALRLAQAIVEENKKLKGSLGKNQEALINQAKFAVELEVERAKKKYREAYEAGDPEAVVAAQDELTAAKIKADRIASFKPAPLQEEEKEVETQQIVQAPQADPRALAWQRQNQWFGSDEEMTSFALGLHQKLVKSGIDPRSDEYYERIDSRMRQVFSDAFDSPEDSEKVEKPTRAKASVVAPATRSTSSKKIVLTQTQVNIAKRLGVPLELYAKKVAEEARKQNG
jgi:hypothetical protein